MCLDGTAVQQPEPSFLNENGPIKPDRSILLLWQLTCEVNVLNYIDVLTVLSENKINRNYPGKQDSRYSDNFITPGFQPKFGIDMTRVNSVFTIGSCFARYIEEVLEPMGISLPTKRFIAPKDEWRARPNGLLNEFNPGSISQKIISTLRKEKKSEETIFKHADSYHDLLLCGGSGVSYERAVSRRQEIDSVYEDLINSEVVIITLGFIEAWYDNATKQWLNRMPPYNEDIEPNRFIFKRLGCFLRLNLTFDDAENVGFAKNNKVFAIDFNLGPAVFA